MHSSNRTGPADASTLHATHDAPTGDAAADLPPAMPAAPVAQTEMDLTPAPDGAERKAP
jgi:hypothetical protein